MPVWLGVIALLLIIALLLAYIGASAKVAMLQHALDNIWPLVRALGNALDADAAKTRGEASQN